MLPCPSLQTPTLSHRDDDDDDDDYETGLADPGPLAAMFWLDDGLGSEIFLDGIVTVIDAKYGLEQLTEARDDPAVINEAVQQAS